MDLNNIFNEYFQEQNSKNLREILWDEEPVTFQEFLYSPEHMNFPPYSDRQMDIMDFMFGDDPKNIFERFYSHGVPATRKAEERARIEQQRVKKRALQEYLRDKK